MDCKKNIGQLVLPVFHHVDPGDVRKQSGSFESAFVRHEERFNPEKVNEWRAALTEAGNLAGWNIQDEINRWSAHIEDIVMEVVRRLNRKRFVVKHPVGLHSRLQYLKDLVGIFGPDDVGVVGIYGMGGIGKTTIAKEFYNLAIHHYEHSCFLENVREESKQFDGLVRLQERLLSTLKGKNHRVSSVDQGINLIKERLGCRRVLVVLDDIDQLGQIDSLTGNSSWFGNGSLIIMTTRDKHLLDQADVNYRYEVEELNHEQSVMLFNWHAFESPSPSEEVEDLLEDIVSYAGRLPLALEVLGSSLYNKTREEWKRTLEELEKCPPPNILERLRISFDTLDDTEKDIFLDIACFFNGVKKEFAIKIFDGCGFFGRIGISTLINRCLLKVDMHSRLRMHDLVQDMGRKVVWEKFPRQPGKRTRLWLQDDVCNVLIKNEGSEVIEGIMLDLPMQSRFSTRPFAKMPNLRLLQINNTNLVGSFRGLFKELRWLCWHQFPLECLPTDFHPEKLISLDMQKSNLRMLWRQTKFLGNLTMLDLRQSKSLKTTLNFTGVPNLAELRLGGCEKLSHIHTSIGNLDKLVTLDLEECKNLRGLPNSICHLKSLESLNLGNCAKLKRLPYELGNLKSLRSLDASHVGIKRLPHSIGLLDHLESLSLNGCKNLKNLPSSICNLRSVGNLYLEGCSSLEKFPDQLGDWKGLKEIYASGTRIKQLPDSIGNLCELRSLFLTDCCSLKSLPSSICKLKLLRILRLTNCSNLEELPEQLGDMERLEDIGVSGTSITRLPDSIRQIPYLHTLMLNSCKQLESLPGRNLGLSSIRVLALRDCNLSDDDIPNDIWELSSLLVLDLSENGFSCLPSGLGQLYNLQVLYTSNCTSLLKLPNLSGLRLLRDVVLSYCDKLVEVPGLENLCSLNRIYLVGCSSLSTKIDNFFLQGYTGGLCELYFSRREIPDWFEFQGAGEASLLFHTPLDVEVGSLQLIIWVDYVFGDHDDGFIRIGVHIDNETSGTKWDSEILDGGLGGSCMILGPVIKSGDRIEVSFELEEDMDVEVKCGVHLSSINKSINQES